MSLSPPRVLVMDDDPMVCETARRMLARLGYAVTLAADGAEAVQIYRSSLNTDDPIAVAILDLKVPDGMGGVEAAVSLLDIDPDACLVVSSGATNVPEMREHETYGFSATLAKPFQLTELGMVVGELVE